MSDDINENENDGGEELNDDEATLADDLLDEVSGDDSSDDLLEGFGTLPETTDGEDEEESEEKDDLEDEAESLEDDAEDVDYDLFDDVDEL